MALSHASVCHPILSKCRHCDSDHCFITLTTVIVLLSYLQSLALYTVTVFLSYLRSLYSCPNHCHCFPVLSTITVSLPYLLSLFSCPTVTVCGNSPAYCCHQSVIFTIIYPNGFLSFQMNCYLELSSVPLNFTLAFENFVIGDSNCQYKILEGTGAYGPLLLKGVSKKTQR